MAIISWLAIFPLLTTTLSITSPLLGRMHMVGRIFCNTLLVAPMMTWIVMPTMLRIFDKWLYPEPPR